MDFQERFPELYAAMSAVTDQKALNALVRKLRKQIDTLEYPACDGAIDAFKKEISARFAPTASRSIQEVREDRILHTRDSSGRRAARKW
jgi:hypothetical protein